jgi:hypothetical protein
MDSIQRDTAFHAIGKKVTVDAPAAGAFYQIADVKIKTVSIIVCHDRESFVIRKSFLWMLDHFPVAPWRVQLHHIASFNQYVFNGYHNRLP